MIVEDIKTQRAFSPTIINLGEYVLNPYKGCMHKCLYCYVQTNKFFTKNKKLWGNYIGVKVDFLDVMKKEYIKLKPKKVLIGSTTEVYMPIEKKYKLMRDILNFLNEKSVSYTILTKSSLIERDIDLLKKGRNVVIYLTINQISQKLKSLLELNTSSVFDLWNTLDKLVKSNIKTIVYISPVFPFFTDVEKIIDKAASYSQNIAIENFNPILLKLENLLSILKSEANELFDNFIKIYSNEKLYNTYWNEFRNKIEDKYNKLSIDFYINPFNDFFYNKYNSV